MQSNSTYCSATYIFKKLQNMHGDETCQIKDGYFWGGKDREQVKEEIYKGLQLHL